MAVSPVGLTSRTEAFARDVVDGLTRDPKQLPAKYHYDALGSQLFEAICKLPWYPITRSERRLLARVQDAIVTCLATPAAMIELGAGSGEKIAVLAERLAAEDRPTAIHLVDISQSALTMATRALDRYDAVSVVRHAASYIDGLRAARQSLDGSRSVMVLLLGSNIGNLGAEAANQFLADIQRQLRPGDYLLLGADLVKPEVDLVAAYDDPLGVTAAFNRNLLVRINRELDADFDLDQFTHRVVWNAEASRVESYLVSQREQTVCIMGADCRVRFAAGETIWTESSYKYEPEQLVSMGERAGFAHTAQWLESTAAFALTLFEVS